MKLSYRSPFFVLGLATVVVGLGYASANPHAGGSALKCKLQALKDDASGTIAFTYFTPAGWECKNVFQWVKPGLFNAVLSTETTDKKYQVIQFEHSVVGYSAMRNLPPTGITIHHASDYLRFLMEQIGKKIGAEGMSVADEINEPIPANELDIFAGRSHSDVMDRVTGVNEMGFLQEKFTLDGVPMVASLGTKVEGTDGVKFMPNRPDQVVTEGGTFGVGPTMIVISPEQPNATKVKELKLIASSMTMTPQFLAYWRELTTRMAKIRIGAGIAGRKYADGTFHERSMSQFRGDMALKDANSRQFCNYLLDQQDYKDSRGQTVTLPSSYKHAWDDGQGNYLLTDDPTTDPRGYGSGKWEPMSKFRPGE